MYNKILVPLDGSELSQGVLPHVAPIASGLKIPLSLLHVIDPAVISILSDPKHLRYAAGVESDLRQKSKDFLELAATEFRFQATVETAVEVGDPAGLIADRAAADPGTLIAMATHGRSGIERWLLGSVAEKVLHAAKNPLFLVRPVDHGDASREVTLKRVIVPLDGSKLAETVLPHVTHLAQKLNLEVILLRVFSLLSAGYMMEDETYTSSTAALLDDAKEEATRYLEGKVRDLKGQGLKNVTYAVPMGEAAGDIISLGKKTPDNFIAMCTHGRSGFTRWVLGSVTERVVQHSGDPVLIIRATRS